MLLMFSKPHLLHLIPSVWLTLILLELQAGHRRGYLFDPPWTVMGISPPYTYRKGIVLMGGATILDNISDKQAFHLPNYTSPLDGLFSCMFHKIYFSSLLTSLGLTIMKHLMPSTISFFTDKTYHWIYVHALLTSFKHQPHKS